jgi:hypothetical protein
VPQAREPGAEAEVDFGDVTVELDGRLARCFLFAFRLSYSGKGCHRVYASQAQEAFLEGHVAAFEAQRPGPVLPDGRPMCVSDVFPGRVNDLAAEKDQVFAVLRPFTDQMPCLADGGYDPQATASTPRSRNPGGAAELDIGAQARNMLLRSLRCLGERGFALLKQRWQTLQHVTASSGKSARSPAPPSS